MTRNQIVIILGFGGVAAMGLCFVLAYLALAYLPTAWLTASTSERRIVSSTLPLSLKWTYASSTPIRSSPLVADGEVILRTDDSLIGLDKTSGRQTWQALAGKFIEFPLQDWQDDRLVFPSAGDTAMEAINLRTGESLWTRSAVGDGAGIFATTIRALKVDQSNVYIETGREPVISAFNLQNGTLRWKFEAPPSTGFVSLQGQNGKLYVFVSSDLYILDAPTGQVEKHIVGQFGDGGAPIVSGQNVYLSYLGGLTAKDAQTGKLRWQFEPSCTSASINALRPTIIGNRVYAGSSCRMLYALDSSSGRLLWQKALSADSVPNLVAIGTVAYVMLRDGTLDAFDLNTGADAGKLETTPPSVANGLFTEGLATDGNSLFVTFGDRQLFAFGE